MMDNIFRVSSREKMKRPSRADILSARRCLPRWQMSGLRDAPTQHVALSVLVAEHAPFEVYLRNIVKTPVVNKAQRTDWIIHYTGFSVVSHESEIVIPKSDWFLQIRYSYTTFMGLDENDRTEENFIVLNSRLIIHITMCIRTAWRNRLFWSRTIILLWS